MALHRDDTRRPGQRRTREVGRSVGAGARGDPAPEAMASLPICSVSSLSLATGGIVVLRVVGEIDLGSDAVLRGALNAALDQHPGHLVVDVSEMRFCSVRGMGMLVAAAATAATQGTQYAVSGAPGRVTRFWSTLWPVGQLPIQFPNAAAGVLAALAALADLAAPLDGPAGSRDGSSTRPRARRRTRRGLVIATGMDSHDRLPSTDPAIIGQPK